MAELSVQIGADIKDLQKKISTSKSELKSLEKVSSKSGANISKVGVKASKGIDKLGKSTANANPTLQEFSRVIQDAPFGIQGVGNNITQLTSQFGYLQKSAGGTIPALKTLASSFIGPAGILFAISSVVSILTVYGDELLKSSSATSGLAKATAKYLGEAKAEISTLNQLVVIARDEANSKEVRQGAIDEINKKYSKYLGNLDLESVKTDAVTTSVKSLTNALILKAKVAGLESLITEKTADSSEDIVEAELKRNKALKVLNSEVNKAIKGNSFLNQIIGNVKGDKERLKAFVELTKRQDDVGSAARNASAGVRVALDSYSDAAKEVKSLNNELDDSLTPLIKLQEQFKKGSFQNEGDITNIDDGAVIIIAKKNNKDKSKLDKAYAEKKRKLFAKISADQIKDEEEAIDNFIKRWENVEIKADPFAGLGLEIQNEFNKIIEAQKRLQLQSDVINDAVGSSFRALSNEISNSFQTGNAIIDAFTQSLVNSLTQIAAAAIQSLVVEKLIGIGKNQINRSVSSGNAITVATSAAAALGPGGVVALPGLIASQLAIVNGAFAGLASFAKGGFSGDNNLAYLNKNELVLRPFEQAALFNALKGTGLSNISNNPKINNSSNDLVGEVVLRGQNQVIQLRRAEKRMSRFYN